MCIRDSVVTETSNARSVTPFPLIHERCGTRDPCRITDQDNLQVATEKTHRSCGTSQSVSSRSCGARSACKCLPYSPFPHPQLEQLRRPHGEKLDVDSVPKCSLDNRPERVDRCFRRVRHLQNGVRVPNRDLTHGLSCDVSTLGGCSDGTELHRDRVAIDTVSYTHL